jgi:hypothetical protein
MGWTRCPKCEFTQIASETCLRCGTALPKPIPKTIRPTGPLPTAPPPQRSAAPLIAAAIGLLIVAIVFTLWLRRSPAHAAMAAAVPGATPTPATLDLQGKWHAEKSKTLVASPPRPVLKEVRIDTNRDGLILGAHVLLTDPGNGGAGAGYIVTSDGRRRLDEAVTTLNGSTGGAPVNVDFIPFPPWVPARARLWRALEGQNRKHEQTRYLLLESVEDDYVVQAGINESGFLSYVIFSPAYATGRGVDVLSRVIHPDPGSDLRQFSNLVWDLSGSTDFLTLQVNATVTGPDKQTDRFVLKR